MHARQPKAPPHFAADFVRNVGPDNTLDDTHVAAHLCCNSDFMRYRKT